MARGGPKVPRVVVVFMVTVRGAGHNRQSVPCKTSRWLSHIVRRQIIARALSLTRNGTHRRGWRVAD